MTDEIIFPSQQWFDAYQRQLNDDEAYTEHAEEWGVEFNGDFVFRMTHIPLDGLDPDAVPDTLREQLETNLTLTEELGHVGQAFLGLRAGECTDARLIESAETVSPGFVLTASYESWIDLIRGEITIMDGLLVRDFELTGNKSRLMQYSDAATALIDNAGAIEAAYLHDAFSN